MIINLLLVTDYILTKRILRIMYKIYVTDQNNNNIVFELNDIKSRDYCMNLAVQIFNNLDKYYVYTSKERIEYNNNYIMNRYISSSGRFISISNYIIHLYKY